MFLFGIFLQKSTATTRYILNHHHQIRKLGLVIYILILNLS